MTRKTAADFDQRALDLYDDFAHGRISRRDFYQRIALFTAAGMSAEATIQALLPNYALAQQVSVNDPRIKTQSFEYQSPKGGGKIKGHMAHPAKPDTKFPAVLVIHENRGLNPYIADVARRLALEGFLALAPDGLSPVGGYPGNDDEGRKLQASRNPSELLEDFVAGAIELQKHALSNGKVGAVGFCYGGGVVNELAVRLPEVIKAGVPFYGRQPALADVAKIKAALLIHYAGKDARINEGWPAYEQALKAAGVKYEAFIYEDVNHGFHNDSNPRFDEAAAKLAWQRTIAFFKVNLA